MRHYLLRLRKPINKKQKTPDEKKHYSSGVKAEFAAFYGMPILTVISTFFNRLALV
jgi:hypothetical protein